MLDVVKVSSEDTLIDDVLTLNIRPEVSFFPVHWRRLGVQTIGRNWTETIQLAELRNLFSPKSTSSVVSV